MKNEAGFSLVETLVALVLIAIMAACFASFTPRANLYQTNAANLLADRYIEDVRNTPFGALTPDTDNGNTVTISVHGQNTTYVWRRQAIPMDLNTAMITPGNATPYDVNALLSFHTDSSTPPQVRLVIIAISLSGGATLATRRVIIPNPAASSASSASTGTGSTGATGNG